MLRKLRLKQKTGFHVKKRVGLFGHKTFIFFASSFAKQFSLFDIKMTQEISKREIGSGKLLGMANYNIYFKKFQSFSIARNTNKFSLLKKCA